MDKQHFGRVTIPTDVDVVPETLELPSYPFSPPTVMPWVSFFCTQM